ncbi:MAG TPA: saccharopine dehydrogenase NADP-binding domain-containing protein [Thermoanaerobaculia bacterium]|jgi:predicted dinucleotide-binding enzyme
MIAVFGGYGTFGVQVSRALAAAGLPVRIAGRDGAKAARFAAGLGPGHEGVAADANDAGSCARALAGARVAVHCAGPFSAMSLALPEVCLAAGAHYVDIADDRGWLRRLAALDERFRERGLAAVAGASSLPGISGALARIAARELPAVERARVTLFIGNRNPKGDAAVRAAAGQLGLPFPAPQGALRGFHGREIVDLPPPFGRRAVYDWQSPELDLFPALLGARSVRVKVGFEARLATLAFAGLARLGPRPGRLLLAGLAPLARRLSFFGHSGGYVQVDLWAPGGAHATAALGSAHGGQRMAALPAAFVAQDLYTESSSRRGFATAYEVLGADVLIERLTAAGYELVKGPETSRSP